MTLLFSATRPSELAFLFASRSSAGEGAFLTFRFLFATMALEGRYGFAMSLPIASAKTEWPPAPNPWVLPARALTVFYGCPEMPRLSHHFLPRLLFAEKQILYLDG